MAGEHNRPIGMIAEARVYEHAAGLVARCPGCDAVLMRLVRAPDRPSLVEIPQRRIADS